MVNSAKMLRPVGEPVTLRECPPGPFMFDGTLGFKSEYGAAQVDENGAAMPGHNVRWVISNWPDAYCLESGEFFWGGTGQHEGRAQLIVQPMEVAAPPAMDREAVEQIEKLKPGYPDYVDDPDGLDRFREQVKRESGHDMAVCNNNSLGRLIDTIERLRFERDQALSTLSADAIRQGEGETEVAFEVWQYDQPVAGSTDEADARHYLEVYGQDGPAKLMRVVTVRTEIAATPASHASDGGKA